MTSTLERIYRDALTLTEPERIALIHDLLDSISSSQNEDVEREWSEEIRRRLQDVTDETWRPHEEVIAEARRLLSRPPTSNSQQQ